MTTPNLAEIDYLRQIAAELTEAGHGKKGAIANRACTNLNISNAELYRRLETVGFSTGRKQRSDKGKTIVSVEAAEFVGGFVALGHHSPKRQVDSICDPDTMHATVPYNPLQLPTIYNV